MKPIRHLFLSLLILTLTQLACTFGGLLSSDELPPGQDLLPENTQGPVQEQELPESTVPPQIKPRPNGALLFSDDCVGAGSARTLFDLQYMNLSYYDGACQITANSEKGVLPVLYPTETYMNFIVEYELGVTEPAANSKYGFVFRSDDAVGGLAYYYLIAMKPLEKKIEFDIWKDNQWTIISKSEFPEGFFAPEKTTHMRLEALNNEFRVFLDGNFIADFFDDQISSEGILGIAIVTHSSPDSIYYDKLRVYDIAP